MDDALMYIYDWIWKFALILIITWTGLFFYSSNELEEITKAYAELTAVTGGFTSSQYNDFLEDLRQAGFPNEKIQVTIKATAPDGSNISSKAKNVTPINQSPYPSNPVYCPRGTKIELSIKSTEKSPLNVAYKFLGIDSDISKGSSKRIYMSERVE